MTAATGAVLMLIGGGLDAFGQIVSGVNEKRVQEYNARIAEQQAQATRVSAQANTIRSRREQRYFVGSQEAAYARSGVVLTTGSPLSVVFNTIADSEFDIAISNYNAEVQARGYESEAALRRYYGKQALYGSIAQAGMTMFGSLANYLVKTKTTQPKEPTPSDKPIRVKTSMGTVLAAPPDYYKNKIGQ